MAGSWVPDFDAALVGEPLPMKEARTRVVSGVDTLIKNIEHKVDYACGKCGSHWHAWQATITPIPQPCPNCGVGWEESDDLVDRVRAKVRQLYPDNEK